MMQTNRLDELDNRIIQLLKSNARLSYSEIGNAVGLSRTAVKNRMSALENSGVIKGYRAIIDPLASSEVMPFVINIETEPDHFEAARQSFEAAREIVLLVQTTGRCHMTAICVARDLTAMRERLNAIYKTVPGILSINANTILDVIKGSITLD